MANRCFVSTVMVMFLSTASVRADESEASKVLDRFIGPWRNEIVRQGPESPQKRTLTSNELITKDLKGKYIIGRDVNSDSGVKGMWFMTYRPDSNDYAWTFFNTQGLLGTEWKGTWDAASSTLTSKSSDAPPTWTSEFVSRFTGQDTMESKGWMKNDQGESIFEMSLTKKRQPKEVREKWLATWNSNATPEKELSPELKVLDRLAGTWDVTAFVKKAEWTPEDKRQKSKVVRTWVLDRQFLQDSSTNEEGTENLTLFSYDPKRAAYRSWWFSSEGYTSKSSGQWDAASKSLQLTSTLPTGQASTGGVRFVDDDHHVWNLVITDASGKIYFDCTWNCARAKP